MTREFRILIAGYGTVGQALHQMILDRNEAILDHHDVRLSVRAVCRSKGGWCVETGSVLLPADMDDRTRQRVDVPGLIKEGVADLLVELTPTDLGTGGAGISHCRAALSRGMHVVTANKGPLVLAYKELSELATKNDVQLRFEATAGAAIPLMNLKEACLRGDRITRIEGILNGTSNHILTRMGEEGLDFEQALEEAQALGYAEADPTADVGGFDAAAKLVILGNHYFGLGIGLGDVAVTGITAVTGEAVQLAHEQGFAVRLVGTVSEDGHAEVAPRLVPLASPLNVSGTLNMVRLHAENAGPITLSGHGAGGKETAAAVLSDILAIALDGSRNGNGNRTANGT